MAEFFDPHNTGFGTGNARYNPANTGYGAATTPAPSAGPVTDALAAANRAARVARYGEEAVAKLEAAGAKTAGYFRGAPSVGPVLAAPTTAIGRMAAEVPLLSRGLGVAGPAMLGAAKALPVVGTAAGVIAEGVDTLSVAGDPNATKIDVATRAAEGAGRLGAMGAGAGLGLAGFGPIGAVAGGAAGYFAPNAVYAARDALMGRGGDAAPIDAPTVLSPKVAATRGAANGFAQITTETGEFDQATAGQNNLRVANAPGFGANRATPAGSFNVASASTFATADPAASRALSEARRAAAARGDFGAVRASYQANGGTFQGKTALQDEQDAVRADAFGAVRRAKTIPQQRNAIALVNTLLTSETARANAAATLGVRQGELTVKQATAAVDAVLKGAQTAEAFAKAGVTAGSVALARAHQLKNPGDPQTTSNILHGRSAAGAGFKESTTSIPERGSITMHDAQGRAIKVPIKPAPVKVTPEQFAATRKAHQELSPAETKRLLVQEGHDVSGIQ